MKWHVLKFRSKLHICRQLTTLVPTGSSFTQPRAANRLMCIFAEIEQQPSSGCNR